MSGEDRYRMSYEEAKEALVKAGPMIMHLIDNEDGTFSIMMHINCMWCDWCEEQGDCRGNPNVKPVKWKPDPYENEKRKEDEMYKNRGNAK